MVPTKWEPEGGSILPPASSPRASPILNNAMLTLTLAAVDSPHPRIERINAARATAPAHFIPVRRFKCPACDHILPPQGPCPECGHEPLQLPLSTDASTQLARALDTLARRHHLHSTTSLIAIPASLAPFFIPAPLAALAPIPPALWAAHALLSNARLPHTRMLSRAASTSFLLAMLGLLTLSALTAAIPLIPPSTTRFHSLLAAPNPVSYLLVIPFQMLFLASAAQLQLVTIDALRSVPHKPSLAPRAMILLALAFALIIPGLFFQGAFWIFIAPLALLLILTTNHTLSRECRVWARSVMPPATSHA